MKKTIIVIYTYLFFILSCVTITHYSFTQCISSYNPTEINVTTIEHAEKPEVWLTIFVHGIMSIQPHLTSENFWRFFQDNVKNTPYERAVYYIRQDKFFYKNQLMQKFGLHKIDIHNIKKENATSALANVYQQVAQMVEPERQNHYYTFGWSGLLSRSERYVQAEHLFLQLCQKITKFKSRGIKPKIRLVGYSHGVNVCLNIAAIKRDKYPDNTTLSIDELIVMGGPIQNETDYLVNDEIFKKVYNFYSEKDRIQPIDFFSRERLFSGKRFKSRLSFCLNPDIRQVQIEINRLRITNECNRARYLEVTKNMSVPGVISGQNTLFRNMSPGHIELWFFSWSPKHYRENFVLNPFPVLVYLPYIIHQLEKNIDAFNTPLSIVADIRPEHEQIVFKQGNCNQCVRVTPFISNETRERFNSIAEATRPDSYTEEEYDEHLYAAIDKANRDFYCPYSSQNTKRERKNMRRMRKRTVACPENKPCVIIYK